MLLRIFNKTTTSRKRIAEKLKELAGVVSDGGGEIPSLPIG